MRILTRRLYRAFPELDRFNDLQCERLMRRVHLDAWARLLVRSSAAVVFVTAFVFVLALLNTTDVLAPAEKLFRDGDILFALLCLLALPAFIAALTRDAALRRFLIRAIRLRIDRVRCLGCKYILIGQRCEDGAVTCPECGQINSLLALGIAEEDLMPPASELDELSAERAADRTGA